MEYGRNPAVPLLVRDHLRDVCNRDYAKEHSVEVRGG